MPEEAVQEAAPVVTRPDKRASPLPLLEASPRTENLLGIANTLLTRPEARTWKEGSWVRREAPLWYQKVAGSETFLGLNDATSKTSFMVSQGPEIGGKSRYTQIRWAELPDEEGGYVKRSGYVKFTYDSNGRVISITGDNGEQSVDPRLGHTLFNDAFWYSGEGATGIGLNKTPLNEQQVTDIMINIMPRLETAATSGVDQQFTERACEFAKVNDALGKAACDLADAMRSGKPSLIEDARQRHLAAVDVYYVATGRDPQQEQEKRKALEQERDQENKEDEKNTPWTRGIIPQDILEDPDFPVLRQEVQTKLLLQASLQGVALVPQDEIDRRVIEEYNARKARIAELQKL